MTVKEYKMYSIVVKLLILIASRLIFGARLDDGSSLTEQVERFESIEKE